jgi:ribosomal protein S18 acetylase RimI-like enzyme
LSRFDVEIEKAGPDQLLDAFELNCEYCEAFDIVVREDEAAFRGYFTDRSGFWLVRIEGQAVGCIGLRPLPACGPRACEVKRLYVRPAWRGQRLADRLLDAVEAFAAEVGYEEAFLDTKDDLEAAIRFYRRRGYEDCPRYNDNPQATIFMRRSLRAPR